MPVENRETNRHPDLLALARPVALLLALLATEEVAPGAPGRVTAILLGVYLGVSLALLLAKGFPFFDKVPYPPEIDVVVLAILLALTPSLAAFWFFYLFTAYALALRERGARGAMTSSRPGSVLASDAAWLSAGAAIAVIVRSAWLVPASLEAVPKFVLLAVGTFLSGIGAGWLGLRERTLERQEQFLESLIGMLRVERGLGESIRLMLSAMAREFGCERALLVVCDEEVERLFVWRAGQDRRHALSPDALPAAKSAAYLAEDLSHSVCWNSLAEGGKGFGWHRETGREAKPLEAPVSSLGQELHAKTVMAATVLTAGHPSGRLLVVNGRKNFSRRDLRWLERVVAHLNVPLENVFLLRSFRARALEAERSRISRDLHDGVLQTLLSLNIQLGVMQKRLPDAAEQVARDLSQLEKTVRSEGEELRQMVKDLRPLRVESADLREMMFGFAERYHNESGLAVDLFLEENDLRAPDRICREVFQIYRESLNNIKKHARASHVVVKLWQDDTKVFLVVDDNGQGFSFSGSFGSEELDRLRLGPISIKERTRSVGGVLRVESNPGHGARLTVEIPLN